MNARELFSHWDRSRDLLYTALDRLTDEQMSFAPSPSQWSLGTLFRHIAEAEAGWMSQPLTGEARKWEAFTEEAYPTREAIKELLMRVHNKTLVYLETLDVQEMDRITFPLYDKLTPVSWFIWQVLDHEIHHRGQIFMLMRTAGAEPPLA